MREVRVGRVNDGFFYAYPDQYGRLLKVERSDLPFLDDDVVIVWYDPNEILPLSHEEIMRMWLSYADDALAKMEEGGSREQ